MPQILRNEIENDVDDIDREFCARIGARQYELLNEKQKEFVDNILLAHEQIRVN